MRRPGMGSLRTGRKYRNWKQNHPSHGEQFARGATPEGAADGKWRERWPRHRICRSEEPAVLAIVRLAPIATGSVFGVSRLNKMRAAVIPFPAKQKTAETTIHSVA